MNAVRNVEEIRVVVVSPVRVYLDGVERLLRGERGIAVAGTARDAKSASELLDGSRADVVLLDVTGEHGLDALHGLAAMTALPLVVLGVPDRPDDVVAYAQAGVAGYVTDQHTIEDLVAAVWSAFRGEFSCSAGVAARLATRLALLANQRHRPSLAQLTSREQEIVSLIETGSSNKEIARRLHIQLATVKNHVHNILEKLDVRSRGEAAAIVRHTRAAAGHGRVPFPSLDPPVVSPA
jgi:two-component system nitrate/nitrite response regulator NarL